MRALGLYLIVCPGPSPQLHVYAYNMQWHSGNIYYYHCQLQACMADSFTLSSRKELIYFFHNLVLAYITVVMSFNFVGESIEMNLTTHFQ